MAEALRRERQPVPSPAVRLLEALLDLQARVPFRVAVLALLV
jgi:hypothetical protein